MKAWTPFGPAMRNALWPASATVRISPASPPVVWVDTSVSKTCDTFDSFVCCSPQKRCKPEYAARARVIPRALEQARHRLCCWLALCVGPRVRAEGRGGGRSAAAHARGRPPSATAHVPLPALNSSWQSVPTLTSREGWKSAQWPPMTVASTCRAVRAPPPPPPFCCWRPFPLRPFRLPIVQSDDTAPNPCPRSRCPSSPSNRRRWFCRRHGEQATVAAARSGPTSTVVADAEVEGGVAGAGAPAWSPLPSRRQELGS
eukprot:COSAG01_NODE_7786_length_3057_cov_8.888438_4_plen_258_part_00